VASGGPVNVPWTAMMRTSTFYLIFPHALRWIVLRAHDRLSGVAHRKEHVRAQRGQPPRVSSSLYSACNAAGRVAWGAISDRLGYLNAIILIYGVVALSMLVLVSTDARTAFTIGIVGLGLCFGGRDGVFPALVMKNFGPPVPGDQLRRSCSPAYSLSAYFGPKIAAEHQRIPMAVTTQMHFTRGNGVGLGGDTGDVDARQLQRAQAVREPSAALSAATSGADLTGRLPRETPRSRARSSPWLSRTAALPFPGERWRSVNHPRSIPWGGLLGMEPRTGDGPGVSSHAERLSTICST